MGATVDGDVRPPASVAATREAVVVVAAVVLLVTAAVVGFAAEATGPSAVARVVAVGSAVLAAVAAALWRQRRAPLAVHLGVAVLLCTIAAATGSPLLALPAVALAAVGAGWDVRGTGRVVAIGAALTGAVVIGSVTGGGGAAALPALAVPLVLALAASTARARLESVSSSRELAELLSTTSSQLVQSKTPDEVHRRVLQGALEAVDRDGVRGGPAVLLDRRQRRIVTAAGDGAHGLDGRPLGEPPTQLAAVAHDPATTVLQGDDARTLLDHLGIDPAPDTVVLAPLTKGEDHHATLLLQVTAPPTDAVRQALDALADIGGIAIAEAECGDELEICDARFKSLVEDSADVILVLDGDGVVRYTSPSVQRVWGLAAQDLTGRPFWLHVHPDDGERLRSLTATAMVSQRPDDAEVIRVRDRAGGWRWAEARARALHSGCGASCAVHGDGGPEVVANLRDVTDREALRLELEHRSLHDRLTGLPNRTLLHDRLTMALAAAERHGRQSAVLFVDLDDFKAVNDSLGHSHGDAMLRDFAERLRGCVGPGDTAARMGGDEFAVLLPTVEDPEHVQRVAQEVLDCLAEPFAVGDLQLRVRASVGASCSDGTATADDLLRRADVAMYLAKGEGGNRLRVHGHGEDGDDRTRLRLTAELQRAVEHGEVVAHFQPIVALDDRSLVGFEALARWHHPRDGVLPPSRFMGLAEAVGLIEQLDLAMFRQACGQLRRWQLLSDPRSPRLTMNVNMSGLNIMSPQTLGQVRAILDDTGVEPADITIELTEGVLLHGAAEALHQLLSFKQLGIRLAVDDFGVGYSSLAYLQQFPVDVLKIDRSFVDVIDGAPQDGTVTRSIIDLAARLDLALIAEGIERTSQLDALRTLACGLGQGFLLSAALSPAAAESMVRDGRVIPPS